LKRRVVEALSRDEDDPLPSPGQPGFERIHHHPALLRSSNGVDLEDEGLLAGLEVADQSWRLAPKRDLTQFLEGLLFLLLELVALVDVGKEDRAFALLMMNLDPGPPREGRLRTLKDGLEAHCLLEEAALPHERLQLLEAHGLGGPTQDAEEVRHEALLSPSRTHVHDRRRLSRTVEDAPRRVLLVYDEKGVIRPKGSKLCLQFVAHGRPGKSVPQNSIDLDVVRSTQGIAPVHVNDLVTEPLAFTVDVALLGREELAGRSWAAPPGRPGRPPLTTGSK
jgi:hypothetical protein